MSKYNYRITTTIHTNTIEEMMQIDKAVNILRSQGENGLSRSKFMVDASLEKAKQIIDKEVKEKLR